MFSFQLWISDLFYIIFKRTMLEVPRIRYLFCIHLEEEVIVFFVHPSFFLFIILVFPFIWILFHFSFSFLFLLPLSLFFIPKQCHFASTNLLLSHSCIESSHNEWKTKALLKQTFNTSRYRNTQFFDLQLLRRSHMDCRISPRLACSAEDRRGTGFTVGSGGGAFLVGGGGGGGDWREGGCDVGRTSDSDRGLAFGLSRIVCQSWVTFLSFSSAWTSR